MIVSLGHNELNSYALLFADPNPRTNLLPQRNSSGFRNGFSNGSHKISNQASRDMFIQNSEIINSGSSVIQPLRTIRLETIIYLLHFISIYRVCELDIQRLSVNCHNLSHLRGSMSELSEDPLCTAFGAEGYCRDQHIRRSFCPSVCLPTPSSSLTMTTLSLHRSRRFICLIYLVLSTTLSWIWTLLVTAWLWKVLHFQCNWDCDWDWDWDKFIQRYTTVYKCIISDTRAIYSVKYIALPIYRGYFSTINSRKTTLAHPLWLSIGVFFESEFWPKVFTRRDRAVCIIMLFCTAIYRESTVFGTDLISINVDFSWDHVCTKLSYENNKKQLIISKIAWWT